MEANNVPDSQLVAIGRQAGVTDELASCHTAKVGNYIVEGHVPAADIQRMLKEKPAIAGIAAPGMPMGSPGMEQGGRKEAVRRDRVHEGRQEDGLRETLIALPVQGGGNNHLSIGPTRSAHASSLCVAPSYSA